MSASNALGEKAGLSAPTISAALAEKGGVELVHVTGPMDHLTKVQNALDSLKNASEALGRKIAHEEGRLQRGLTGSEKDATEKFVSELKHTRDQVQDHAEAVQRVLKEAPETAK